MHRSARQSAVARREHSENDGGNTSGDSWVVRMETDEQQLTGAGDRGRMTEGLNSPDDPAEVNMSRGSRLGRGGARPLPIPAQVPPAGHRNPPFQSPDAVAMAGVLPLINMVHSQEDVSLMVPESLGR